MAIPPVGHHERQICRQFAKLMFHTFLVHPTRAISILDEDQSFATELVTSKWYQEGAWNLGMELFEAVDSLADQNDPEGNEIPYRFRVLSDQSLAEMSSKLAEDYEDPASPDSLACIRTILARAVDTYHQIYNGNSSSIKVSESNLDDMFSEMLSYESMRAPIWVSFMMCVEVIDKTKFEFKSACTHNSVKDLDGKAGKNPIEIVQFMIHKIAEFSDSSTWTEFSLVKRHMIGNPAVMVLLNWVLIVLSIAPFMYRLVETDNEIRKRVDELYREVVTPDIKEDCPELDAWLSSFA